MRERQSKKPADRENGSEKKTETNFIDKNKRKKRQSRDYGQKKN